VSKTVAIADAFANTGCATFARQFLALLSAFPDCPTAIAPDA